MKLSVASPQLVYVNEMLSCSYVPSDLWSCRACSSLHSNYNSSTELNTINIITTVVNTIYAIVHTFLFFNCYEYIVDSYWIGMRTIAHLLSLATTTIFRIVEEEHLVEGDNKYDIVLNTHPITVLLYQCKLWM
jgi:hypothetical protein